MIEKKFNTYLFGLAEIRYYTRGIRQVTRHILETDLPDIQNL